MLELDHLSVIAPTLEEGVGHVRECLDLDVPFGQRHAYMGTHNHLVQLGDTVYLEVVALDPDAKGPGRPRWFGLDNARHVRSDWDAGRRLRGWVARCDGIRAFISGREHIFGNVVSLPWTSPSFEFSLPDDGSLPSDGAVPSIIDRRGKPRAMATIADLGARLRSFVLQHPDPAAISKFYEEIGLDRRPIILPGNAVQYRAEIQTPFGIRELF